MAIQNRRGIHTDFDATKMVAGEFAVVQSGDPNNTNGTSVYICFQNGSAKRLTLIEDLDAVVGSLGDLETTDKTSIVDAINELAEKSSILFGTSATTGSTRDKVVTCADFEAVDGALIAITLSQTNTVTDARFNVNGTGAKSIYSNHEASNDTSWLTKGSYLFVYSSTNGGRFTLIGATERIASDTAPVMDGTAAVGTSKKYARADHVHPSDTSRATVAALNETNAQVTQLKEDLSDTLETAQSDALQIYPVFVSGGTDSAGNIISNNTRIRSYAVPISKGDFVETDGIYAVLVRIYNSITVQSFNYYGVSGDYQTGKIDLSKYDGKIAIIVARKIGSESSNISADVPTIGQHVFYSKSSQLKDLYISQKSEYGIQPLTENDFNLANISGSGVITWLDYSNGYGNAATKDIRETDIKIVPVSDDVMFRIIEYNPDGTWLANSAWYSKSGTSVSTATKGISVNNKLYRLMIASTVQNQNKSIKDMLSGFEFSTATFRNPIIPFSGYKIDAKLTKEGNVYKSGINPYDTFIKLENGINVFMSPDGLDTNDGLTVLTPKKTLASALAVTNVNTIILAEGTYEAGTHYAAGAEITQAVNLIGVGNVIFDNQSGMPLNFYRSIFCDNIHFKGGNNTVVVKLGAYDRVATFYHCTFTDSIANNGLAIQGGLAYVIECEAYNNAFDGFNYHAYNSIMNHTIEVDCKSSGNGTINLTAADGQSSNATTSHDGSYIVRVNGEYSCCHGGIVADKDCYSANYGCSAGVSTVTDATNYPDRMSNYWSSGATMYLYDCISFGSKYDTAIIRNGTITSDKIYASNYTA